MTDPYLTPEDRAPQELIESVRAQIDVTKKSLKDEFIKPDRIMSNIYVADAEALVAALQASEERERRKDEALRFYADEENWRIGEMGDFGFPLASHVESDGGRRAREALDGGEL